MENSKYEKLMTERARVTKKYVGSPHMTQEEVLKCAKENRAAKLGQPFCWNKKSSNEKLQEAKLDVNVEITKTQSGVYKDNAENCRLNRVGRHYDNATNVNFNATSLTSLLNKYEEHATIQSIFDGVNNNAELKDIDRALKLIHNNKIKINKEFKVQKTDGGMGMGNKKICWESAYDIGRSVEMCEGKQGSQTWATVLLQQEIFKQIAQRQGVLIGEEEQKTWEEPFDEASEAQVYHDPTDIKRVIKTVNATTAQSQSIPSFIGRTMGFNVLFPETKYDLIGFVEDEEATEGFKFPLLKPAIRQDFVGGKDIGSFPKEKQDALFKQFLQQYKDMGYEVDVQNQTISKHGFEASDLNYGNVRFVEGQFFVIDAFVKFIGNIKQSTAIKQFLSRKTDEELHDIINNTDNIPANVKLGWQALTELKQRQNERKEEFKEDIQLASDVINGRRSILRLAEAEERGRLSGGRRNVEASICLGRRGCASGQAVGEQGLTAARKEQETILEKYARGENIWLDYHKDIVTIGKELPHGMESTVFRYADKDGKQWVVKVTDYTAMEETPMTFLDNHISLANALSPQTNYELMGFTKRSGNFCFVVRQPFIEGVELDQYVTATPVSEVVEEEIKQFERVALWMKKEYGVKMVTLKAYCNERYCFDDLHLRNVMEKDGKFYLIDLIAGLNTPEDEGGKAKYLQFKIVDSSPTKINNKNIG